MFVATSKTMQPSFYIVYIELPTPAMIHCTMPRESPALWESLRDALISLHFTEIILKDRSEQPIGIKYTVSKDRKLK